MVEVHTEAVLVSMADQEPVEPQPQSQEADKTRQEYSFSIMPPNRRPKPKDLGEIVSNAARRVVSPEELRMRNAVDELKRRSRREG